MWRHQIGAAISCKWISELAWNVKLMRQNDAHPIKYVYTHNHCPQVDQLSKDIKTTKKKSDQFASEASQLGLQLRGVREELRVEKERSKAISEHVGLLKESVDQKQSAILEMKRKVCMYVCTRTTHTLLLNVSLGLSYTYSRTVYT